MDFLKLVKENKENLLKDLVTLLQMDTVGKEQLHVKEAPFGENVRDALLYMLRLGEKEGFKTENIDNVAGHIEYGEGEEIIGVLCHLDVVPAGDGWTYPPFGGTIVDGKIYARGALDDKGPAMSSFYALKILKDAGVKLNKRVRLILGTDEESGMRCVKRYLEVCKMPDLGFSPDANFPLIYGEKGIMSIDLLSEEKESFSLTSGERYNVVPDSASVKINQDLKEEFTKYLETHKFQGEIKESEYKLFGVSSHAMEPEKGVNALINLSIFLSKYTSNNLVRFIAEKLNDTRFKTLKLDFSDSEMKDLTVNVAFARIDENGGKVGLNLRYPINWDKDTFLDKFSKEAENYGIKVVVKEDSNPHFVDRNSKLVRTLHDAYIKYTGDDKTKLMTIGGGTYARTLGNAVAFGMLMPGREDVVHKRDEYIYIDDLITSIAIYAEAIYKLGTKNETKEN
ncbi:MAG TPA: dipeptidase PepV [Acholeplasmataceae bacterium]|nr:dipeptidase PepV [Acholeplasmataceae bacterium]